MTASFSQGNSTIIATLHVGREVLKSVGTKQQSLLHRKLFTPRSPQLNELLESLDSPELSDSATPKL